MVMCADIHDFYYNNPTVDFEYMNPPLRIFHKDIVHQYNLKDLVAAYGYVYTDTRKGIPGRKQAERLSSDRLTKNLARNGCAPIYTQCNSGDTTHQTSHFILSLTTLESSTHKRRTPTTCLNPSRKNTRSPRNGQRRNT